MADYNYGVPAFRKWWTDVWLTYVTEYDVDGFRLDGPNGISPSSDVLTSFDAVVDAAAQAGKEIVVFGEETDYYFGEHDLAGQSARTLVIKMIG